MPNWCNTMYRVLGDEKEREELYNAIKSLEDMEEPLVENGFGNLWLGCLINYLGGDWNNVNCKGEITSYNNHEDHLEIITETAWAECYEVRMFLAEKFPKLEFYYIAEEPGMCEYYTNDNTGMVFKWKYRLDIHTDEDWICDDFETIEEVANEINALKIDGLHVEPDFNSIVVSLRKYEDEHEDEDFYGGVYEYKLEK